MSVAERAGPDTQGYQVAPWPGRTDCMAVSNPRGQVYQVTRQRCGCPSFQFRGGPCKHQALAFPPPTLPERLVPQPPAPGLPAWERHAEALCWLWCGGCGLVTHVTQCVPAPERVGCWCLWCARPAELEAWAQGRGGA